MSKNILEIIVISSNKENKIKIKDKMNQIKCSSVGFLFICSRGNRREQLLLRSCKIDQTGA